LVALASEVKKISTAQGNSTETPERIPIREAMNTIRAIIARVKGGGAVGADDLSALSAAFNQLGMAAVECKAAHNLPELSFIRHVRGLLGSFLGKSVPDSDNPLPRIELTESGSLAEGFKSNAGSIRSDFSSAGVLAGSLGPVGEAVAGLPRVDIDMGGVVAHASGQTLENKTADHGQAPKVVLNEEPGRIRSGSLDPGKSDLSLRFSALEQIGVLISQREQADKSVT
jgi:hypothetical protein